MVQYDFLNRICLVAPMRIRTQVCKMSRNTINGLQITVIKMNCCIEQGIGVLTLKISCFAYRAQNDNDNTLTQKKLSGTSELSFVTLE